MRQALKSHRIIALDTSPWIYHLEDHPRFRFLTAELLEAVHSGRCQAVISEITLLELLVRPLQLENQDVADEYEILLEHFPNLTIVPVTRNVSLKAAWIRARYGLRVPDAIIIATGILHRATLAITNDRKWKAVEKEVKVLCLDDLKEGEA